MVIPKMPISREKYDIIPCFRLCAFEQLYMAVMRENGLSYPAIAGDAATEGIDCCQVAKREATTAK